MARKESFARALIAKQTSTWSSRRFRTLSATPPALRTLWKIQILHHICPDNVISLKDIMLTSSPKAEFRQVYLVHEMMDTDLHHLTGGTGLSSGHCKFFLNQILLRLKHIHFAYVIHRDLKPGNILLNKSFEVKICDSGLACTKSYETQVMTKYLVIKWYRAPELLMGSYWYENAVDMWSTGCLLVEMLGRRPIFPITNSLSQIHMINTVLGTQPDLSFIGCPRTREYMEGLPYSPEVKGTVICKFNIGK